MDQEDFYKTALIAALQALIHNNPGISCKYAAKKAQEYAEQLALLQYGEYNPNPFPTKVL
jgi:hypothetical protein